MSRQPNFIVILCDDLGYGDTQLYGESLIETPNILRMAREGVTLTDYYAPANICTPSRAGMLTGRYPVRTGLGFEVIMQADDRGLPLSEPTIPKALAPDYVSGLFGKWHLGHRGEAWPPTRHGFETFFGIPYSHDMAPLSLCEAHAGSDAVIESAVDFPRLQQDFTDRAIAFIEDHRQRPFFAMLALSAPHLPCYPLAPHDPDTSAGPYGAVVREIDAIVGRVLETRPTALGWNRTPWSSSPPTTGRGSRARPAGCASGRGAAPTTAATACPSSPGRPAACRKARDRSPSPWASICCRPSAPWRDCRFRAGVTLDGRDLSDVLAEGAASPHEALSCSTTRFPIGLRSQDHKYLVSAYYRGFRFPVARMGYEELYDLRSDPSENYSVAKVRPDVLDEMKTRLEKAVADFRPFRSSEIPPVFKALRRSMAERQD